jgi:4-hydroxybenzoate polyprenyltransferase
LFVYALASFAYSKFLKKIPIMDIMTLSSLYLLRVVIGGALLDITISNWLLTFSVFFFLFLAALKRWIELKRLNAAALPGRGYSNLDTQFISNLSYFSGLISVLVICLYIDSQQALTLYNESKLLWLIPIILLYWILETLLKVNRNQVDDDPVKYALKSKTSYISFIGFIIILIFA